MLILGILTLVGGVQANLCHLLFTLWAISEQLDTGWGYGTNMEMAVLLPWTLELVSIPVVILGLVYFLLTRKKPAAKWLKICCAVLLVALLLQIGIFNLFVFM